MRFVFYNKPKWTSERTSEQLFVLYVTAHVSVRLYDKS